MGDELSGDHDGANCMCPPFGIPQDHYDQIGHVETFRRSRRQWPDDWLGGLSFGEKKGTPLLLDLTIRKERRERTLAAACGELNPMVVKLSQGVMRFLRSRPPTLLSSHFTSMVVKSQT